MVALLIALSVKLQVKIEIGPSKWKYNDLFVSSDGFHKYKIGSGIPDEIYVGAGVQNKICCPVPHPL